MLRLILISSVALLAGCTSDERMRMDGVTYGAGDAIAANTAMQMVDPWQPGVEDTDLLVPAKRASTAEQTASSAFSAAPKPSSNP